MATRPLRKLPARAALAATGALLTAPVWIAGATAGAQPGETTTTLPIDTRTGLGDIVPKPNSGREPLTPGDPGGWQQGMLFFLICGAIILIACVVIWTGMRARKRRDAAGFDPVELARQRGEGVRRPPQPQT